MSRAGILTGVLAGVGLLLMLISLVRTQPRLDDVIARLTPSDAPPLAVDEMDLTAADPTGAKDRLGQIGMRLGSQLGLQAPLTDLTLVGRTTRWYWAEKASSALLGFLTPLLLNLFIVLFGLPVPALAPLALSVGLGVYFWFLPDLQMRARAAKARAAFNRAAVAYLQLMAIHRNAGDIAIASMRGAADVSESWMFLRIREEITRCTLAGTPVYDGVTRLGDRTGITTLREVGDIMRIAGESGAGVSASLLSRASDLRDEILALEHTQALTKTNAMNFPIVLIALLVAALLIIPASVQFVGL